MLVEKIKSIVADPVLRFEEKALHLYKYQYTHNPIYQQFVDIVKDNGYMPTHVGEIPHLPISLFKSNAIMTGEWTEQLVFQSSGTTGMMRSQHLVRDESWYHFTTRHIWESQFGPLKDFEFIALLPNYHDNPSSSLLSMVSFFMSQSRIEQEQFFLHDLDALAEKIESTKIKKESLVLFGVSFALLRYLEEYKHESLSHLKVIETGGMKKFRKEITRNELHALLRAGFGGATIYSEYGMTECFSQLYTNAAGRFVMNDRMHICLGDPTDPGAYVRPGQRGRILITDLANIDTISFIATDDLGRMHSDGSLEILGRIDASDLRGCNYLI